VEFHKQVGGLPSVLLAVAPGSTDEQVDFAGIPVIARGDDLEFPGLHPFGKDWFGLLQLLGDVERLGAHGIFDRIARLVAYFLIIV
jgi:hypothetical protein